MERNFQDGSSDESDHSDSEEFFNSMLPNLHDDDDVMLVEFSSDSSSSSDYAEGLDDLDGQGYEPSSDESYDDDELLNAEHGVMETMSRHLHALEAAPGFFTFALRMLYEHVLGVLEPDTVAAAKEDVLSRLATVPVTAQRLEANESCCICFVDLALHEEVLELPCSHIYHKPCIVNWLVLRSNCPKCRFDVDLAGSALQPNDHSTTPLSVGSPIESVANEEFVLSLEHFSESGEAHVESPYVADTTARSDSSTTSLRTLFSSGMSYSDGQVAAAESGGRSSTLSRETVDEPTAQGLTDVERSAGNIYRAAGMGNVLRTAQCLSQQEINADGSMYDTMPGSSDRSSALDVSSSESDASAIVLPGNNYESRYERIVPLIGDGSVPRSKSVRGSVCRETEIW